MSRAKRAFITGVNGQDGILLGQNLLAKGYEVAGVGSQESKSKFLSSEIQYTNLDVCNTDKLIQLIEDFKPREFYNLASISSVAKSFEEPETTWDVNARAVDAILTKLSQSFVSSM